MQAMKNSMMFEGAWVQVYTWQNQVIAIYTDCIVLDDRSTLVREVIKPIPYTPEWAEKVMPEGWSKHFYIEKSVMRPGWCLEARGTDLYFEFVHELQLLVAALRLEEEMKMLIA
jgi:hypothetical protein